MNGAIERIAQAKGAIQHENVKQKGEYIGKAISIIGGLDGCLDHSQPGELSQNLSGLYEYMIISLTQANMGDDIAKLNETTALLMQIKSAWEQIPAYIEPNEA
jgi:flagellar protein FliS